MPLHRLAPDMATTVDHQDTDFTYDIVGRYLSNNWSEIQDSINGGGYPFDAVVVGAGMFGAYCAEKLYRLGSAFALRVLVLEAGAFLLPSHIQNLPQRLGGKIGGPDFLRNRDDGNTQNVIWGMPWISNEFFPGLAYCIGGRSLFWGGWSPRLTSDDLANWPQEVRSYLLGATGADGIYKKTEKEIGVDPTTDYMTGSFYDALKAAFDAAKPNVTNITAIEEAPLAVQGSAPGPGLFPFDKFSSGPWLIDALRNDASTNFSHGDVSRRMLLVPRAEVLRLNTSGNTVTSIDLRVNGTPQQLQIAPTCAVILANGTVEATRLSLEWLGIGSTQTGSPRVGNLMGHLRSNIVVRVKRSALGIAGPPTELETAALLVRGSALGRRFHFQVTAASVFTADSEQNMWSMVPDIDLQDSMKANQNPDWVVITFRAIGEMEDRRSLSPDPNRSWIDLSNETDPRTGMRRAYVNLVATKNDNDLWIEMDKAAFALALKLAQDNPANIQYFNKGTGQFQDAQPQPDANGKGFWQDLLGTTHHEAGTLFMGAPGSSITDTDGKFHSITNGYVAGPALFPTLGSANPSLTTLSLARRVAEKIVQRVASLAPEPGFSTLSLNATDWRMVKQAPNQNANFKHYGKVLESFDAYGLYWYVKEQFGNFILRLDWRVGRRDDNSGVYIRIPAPTVSNPLQAADNQGHEIQIDERGFDSVTNTEGNSIKRTGAIYDLQAPTSFPSNPIGHWNSYEIEANGSQIKVTLNGQMVNTYQSTRQTTGFVALQAHHFTSRVQFRNLRLKALP